MNDYKRNTTLNEKDSLMDMLIFEKSLMKLYTDALTESENKNFKNLIKNNFLEISIEQAKIFDILKQEGYYTPKIAEEKEILSVKENFKL